MNLYLVFKAKAFNKLLYLEKDRYEFRIDWYIRNWTNSKDINNLYVTTYCTSSCGITGEELIS